MSVPLQDLIAFRLGRHAARHGTVAWSKHALGTEAVARMHAATEGLLAASNGVLREKADDKPVRDERDEAVTDLVEGVTGALRMAAAQSELAARDTRGRVVRPKLIERTRALVATYLPEGQPSALSLSPDRLIAQARSVITGLADLPGTAEMIAEIERGVLRLDLAQKAITRESDELKEAYAHLDRAREEDVAARREARAWVEFAAAKWQELGLDPERVFPPFSPAHTSETELDAAGVDPAGADPADAAGSAAPPTP